jgi:negative regulator of sigma E activity
MKTKVGVTDAQLSQIEAILDDTKAKYKIVRDQFRPQMLAIKNEQIARVKAVLTPEQVPAYERLIAEHERRAREQDARDRQEGHRH